MESQNFEPIGMMRTEIQTMGAEIRAITTMIKRMERMLERMVEKIEEFTVRGETVSKPEMPIYTT